MKKASRRAKLPRRGPTHGVAEETRGEYDFSGGIRGKYADRFASARVVRVVVLAPEVAEAFGNARAVNAALRRGLTDCERGTRSAGRSRSAA
jgi:hypothetical protein